MQLCRKSRMWQENYRWSVSKIGGLYLQKLEGYIINFANGLKTSASTYDIPFVFISVLIPLVSPLFLSVYPLRSDRTSC
jgi:hypothetical protein